MSVEQLEREVLEAARIRAQAPARPIFILGSPRTGSTLCYQMVVATFELAYFANLTNDHYPTCPILGLAIQAALPAHGQITPVSRYGKTAGLMQPSEASAVLAHWFGGDHPSEVKSASILPERQDHFLATMEAAQGLFGRPLVIKNAWNCFRIRYLASALPEACFIWIRRDLAAAAKSDLAARYVVHGSSGTWNSATPRNVEDLRGRPHWEQVVENQAEFARAISESAASLEPGRFVELWYEDIFQDPATALSWLNRSCPTLSSFGIRRILPVRAENRAPAISRRDERQIDDYIECSRTRFAWLRWPRRHERYVLAPTETSSRR